MYICNRNGTYWNNRVTMAKKIIIEEKQFQKILERYYGKSLLAEMPYSPKDYSTDCAVHAIMVYIHLGKLFRR